MTIVSDLPKEHALRKALDQYKTRFEESLDELLDGHGIPSS